MNATYRRRLLMIGLLLVAAIVPILQATIVVFSTGFHELGFPPIARIDYTVTEDFDRIPAGPRLRYGFFFAIGFVSVLSFLAGRLSYTKSVREPNVA